MASTFLRHKSPSLTLTLTLTLTLNPQKTLISPRFYSNSSSNNDDNNGGKNTPNFASYFSNNKPRFNPQSPSFDEIKKNLSAFRLRSLDSPPAPPPPPPNRSALNSRPGLSKAGEMSMEKIRENLQKMRVNSTTTTTRGNEQFSLNNFKESFRMGPTTSSVDVIGGGTIGSLPMAMFGKEIGGGGDEDDEDGERKYRLVRWYSHAELGARLRELRPNGEDKKKKEGGFSFSLAELQGRLGKLREEEEKMMEGNKARATLATLGSTLSDIQRDKRIQKVPKLDFFSEKSYPPKEHLIEKYFHPDNMSAAEKLKIELKKVRDEFKMSESDCGSTRVQIAQLTTEIHHLSSVLHKKDKHSRRGLQAKVQQRKKLLKYLRRTDWDSYCFVLSKLGLRDNPDYKN